MLVEASRETDAGVRLAATRALGGLGNAGVTDRLQELITDEEPDIRYEALGGLAVACRRQ